MYFPQADQIQPRTEARHKEINRKQPLHISLVKITYLFETLRMADLEQSGKRLISILTILSDFQDTLSGIK
jgi:hypothetical protein